MGFVRIRCRFGGRSLAAALLGTTFLVSLAVPALADSHLESENAELRSKVEDLMQEVQILKNMVVQQGNKMMEAAEPAVPAKMVRSGKDKVSLKVYGQVNRMLILANDGNDSRLFNTDNDSEVAAGYLTWRLREGMSLDEALQAALHDLDGFFTFAIGTGNGFAVLRDPIACKPAVMAETADWVAMASEYRAIAVLPGADRAERWEPEPAKVYSWSH